MKMALNLTFEDGLKVVEAMKKVAIEYGWAAEELDESGVIDEYSRAVDAALAAMGIEVRIDPNPSYEDENEYCDSAADCSFCSSDDEEWHEDEEDGYFNSNNEEEEDDDTTVYSLTAKGEFVVRCLNAGYTFKDACEIADILFGEGEGE